MRPVWLGLLCTLACCSKLPLWEGKVDVKPLERAALKKCGTGKVTAEGAMKVTRAPYLQSTTTTSTMFAWGTRDGKGEVIVEEPDGKVVARGEAVYAGEPDLQKARFVAQQRPGKELTADELYIVKAEVKGLEPSHLYCYRILDDGIALTERAPMSTAAAPGGKEPIHFVAVGDTGTGDAAALAVAKQMSSVPFDFLVFMGDIAYTRGTADQLESKFFGVYRDYLRYVPAYPALGNHERRTMRGRPYFEAFVLPEPERYYSFNWGDVHFVAIDTTQRDSAQLEWLDHDLAANKLPWVIVFGHHPMYTNSFRGPQLAIRKAFAKILTDHKVDLVMTGHEHQYERFKVAGVNYVISGGGGGHLTRFWGATDALKQATVHHFLSFAVTATKLEMRAIDIEGKEIETLTLEKKPTGEVKTKVDHERDERQTPLPPEHEVKPDEKLHDEPDDDTKKDKVPATVPVTGNEPAPAQPPASS
ncbi:MAG TPA: metallophosphoesterase family protein [Kofleriaceae bacterium]|nr:metallophosphoesterase family protein [Kofleriaceae bacterium]